jgi:hypothetical protein
MGGGGGGGEEGVTKIEEGEKHLNCDPRYPDSTVVQAVIELKCR